MVLYKYAGDAGFRILEDLRLKITPPNEFNDPFEITPTSQFTQTLEKLVNEAKTNPEHFRTTYDAMKDAGAYTDSFEKFSRDLPHALPIKFDEYKKLSKSFLTKIDFKTQDTVSRGIGILCLAQKPDSIPMWSYYANHHRGIVFGLDVSKLAHTSSGPSGFVKYRKHRVKIDPYLPHGDKTWKKLVHKTVFTKSLEWQHELEYRRVFQLSNLSAISSEDGKHTSYFLDLSSEAITEIIFGCKIDVEFEKKIRSELFRRKRTFGHIKLFRCHKHDTRFELKVIPT